MPLLPSCESSRWYPAFADVTARGVDKGEGVRTVARHFGFPSRPPWLSATGGNDTRMLQVAGIGWPWATPTNR